MRCRYTRVLTRTEAGRRSIPIRMIASVPSVTTFMTFFFIVVSTFAILGMQLFGGVDDRPVILTLVHSILPVRELGAEASRFL
jgi:hypothetical protein